MDSRTKHLQAVMLGHGFLVMIVGMLSGFMLTFALIGAVDIFPFPAIDVKIPGSVRGWVAAHTGCIMNGLMIIGVALALPRLSLSERALGWVAWGLVATVWGNTSFYLFANVAGNRGLTMGANRFGQSGLAGFLAFAPAFIGAFLVLIALALTASAAFRAAREG